MSKIIEIWKYPTHKPLLRVVDLTAGTAPASPTVKQGDILKPIKLDGMYVWCKNTSNENVYVGAWTKVEIIENEEVGGRNEKRTA